MAEIGVKFRVPQQFMTGFIAGVFSPILVWIVGLIEPIADRLVGAITDTLTGRAALVTGTQIGTELIKILTGKFPELPDLLVAGLGGGALVMLGTWLYNMDWSPNNIPGFKATPWSKMTLILFYASVVATIVLSAFALPALQTLLVLAVNSVVTAWFITGLLQKQLGII